MANGQQNGFFERLRKLFSTKAIIVRDGNKTKVIDHEQSQQMSNLKSLKDRFYRLQTGYKYENFTTQLSYSTIRRELFLDYDAMDNDPIIASALDIYADECLGGETVIPMLNGTKRTISDLYESGENNFWVYGLNESGDFVPVKVEKVAHNGTKKVKKIILEDDTEIFATDDHIWVNNEKQLVKTKDLKEGDELYSLRGEIPAIHFIKSISKEYTEMPVYDLVNAGSNHIYAIETQDGGKLFTHNCTTKNEFGDILTIHTKNQDVKEALHNLFYDVLDVEFNLWPWVRNLCKYGDVFLVLEIVEGEGVVNVHPQSVYHTTRTEGPYDPNRVNKKEPGIKFTVDPDYLGKHEYDNYEMAHFRLYSDTNYLPYGKSMIENGRRLWKQITLMEDAMMIHRIMRAPEKRIFKIDIGNIPAQEVDNYMQRIINKIKKTPFVDQNTGDYNLKYNMMNITEDFFMPVRGGDSGTSIDTLGGLEYAAVEDINYLKAKLFAALKVPKAFLGYEEDVTGKATLAAEDIRFARTIERIQRTVIFELTQVAMVHLIALGFEGMDTVDFEISLTNPSTIYEQEKINLWAEKVRLARDLKELKLISSDFIYEQIFKLSKDEVDKHRQNIALDSWDINRLTQIETQGVDPYETPQQPAQQEGGVIDQPQDGQAEQPEQPTQPTQESSEASVENGKKGGRPRMTGDNGTDDNAFGRDPLGKADVTRNFGRDGIKKKIAGRLKDMTDKEKMLRDAIRKKVTSAKSKRVLTETFTTEGNSILDDKNILPDDNNGFTQ